MFNIGTPELLIILVLAFVVFGPKHLPRLGRAAGKLIGEWRKLTGDLERTIRDETDAAPAAKAPARRSRSHAVRKTRRP